MQIDKAGEYRTSSGQMVEINKIFAGSAYGYFMKKEFGATFWDSWSAEDGNHPTQAELRIVGKWGEESPAKPPHTAARLEDLQLVVSQTLERLMGLQRYAPVPELYLAMSPDTNGDWLQTHEIMEAIEHLRRAMGDCTLDEERQR
jgi:hypothetical protein